MATGRSPVTNPRILSPILVGHVEIPEEVCKRLAYERYLDRGQADGDDWKDWFAAEKTLQVIFEKFDWTVERGDDPRRLNLRGVERSQSEAEICRYQQTENQGSESSDPTILPFPTVLRGGGSMPADGSCAREAKDQESNGIMNSLEKDAILHDLARLMPDHEGQWAAYRGKERLAVDASKAALYQKCLASGLKRNEFVVLKIQPHLYECEPPALIRDV
jgi:hypothetical protein